MADLKAADTKKAAGDEGTVGRFPVCTLPVVFTCNLPVSLSDQQV
jgi:hypothetical protein